VHAPASSRPPAIAFLTTDLKAGAGVVISASHNPPEDNGIKFFGPLGFKLPDELEDEIEAELASGAPAEQASAAGSCRCPRVCATTCGPRCGPPLRSGSTACASSWTARTARRPVSRRRSSARLGAEVDPIFDDPDGSNINVGCGALHPAGRSRPPCGRSEPTPASRHDGDADRALFADADGT